MITCPTTTLPCIKECKEGECALKEPFGKPLKQISMRELPDPDALTLALQIEEMKKVIFLMDTSYIEEVVGKFYEQASFQDSAAVLNPRYDPDKSSLIRKQADTLKSLLSFITGLKQCEELKDKVKSNEAARDKIEQMFW